MKTILTIALLTISSFGFCQSNFYKQDGSKFSVIGEQATLTFTDKNLSIPTKVDKAGFAETLIASQLPGFIDLGFKITTDIIEKNLKKFTSEFSARNTYINDKQYVSGFKVQRKIVLKEGEKKQGEQKEDALVMEFVPRPVGSNAFVFALESISVPYSGAKSKKGYNRNDYTVEIKVTYYDGKEKKEQTSAPIAVQLVEIAPGGSYELKDDTTHLYMSDKFPLNSDFTISEVSVKIIETNTAKVKAEMIKSIYDKYSDDAKETAKNIVNFYIEKSKDKKDEEAGSK